jgi:hypothetical protein
MPDIKKWLWGVAIKKAVTRGVQVLVSLVGAQKLKEYGIEVDVNVLSVAVFLLIDNLRGWLKVSKNMTWL